MGRPKKRPDRIRWKENGHYRSYSPVDQEDAEAFRTMLDDRKRVGLRAPTIQERRQTLAAFVESEWWPKHGSRKAEGTQRRYLEIWGAHLHDRIGYEPLPHIDAKRVDLLLTDLENDGVGAATRKKALDMLSSILRRAVGQSLIGENPVTLVEKPEQPPRKPIRPLPPATIEAIRRHMLGMWQSAKRGAGRSAEELDWWRRRNAVMVAILAYAGLRPSEMQRAIWDDIVGERLYVRDKKRGRAKLKEVELLAPLATDLRQWRMRCGRPNGSDLIVPTYDGDEWQRHDWNNWRRRIYQPAARAVGVREDNLDPYYLRHSFISLLLWAGEDAAYVAGQCGNSPRTIHDHYEGTIRELRGQPKTPAAEAIQQARDLTPAAQEISQRAGVAGSGIGRVFGPRVTKK